jgi:hypothetical protein
MTLKVKKYYDFSGKVSYLVTVYSNEKEIVYQDKTDNKDNILSVANLFHLECPECL